MSLLYPDECSECMRHLAECGQELERRGQEHDHRQAETSNSAASRMDPPAEEEARRTYDFIRQFLRYALRK